MGAAQVDFGPFNLSIHGGRWGPSYVVKRRNDAGTREKVAYGTAQVVGMELTIRHETRSRYNWELRRLAGFLAKLPDDPADPSAAAVLAGQSDVHSARARRATSVRATSARASSARKRRPAGA